jgi:hypothetical protein
LVETLDEILCALDRCALGANLKAPGVDGKDERSAASFGRPRLRRVIRRGDLSDELRRERLSSLTVD